MARGVTIATALASAVHMDAREQRVRRRRKEEARLRARVAVAPSADTLPAAHDRRPLPHQPGARAPAASARCAPPPR